MKKREAIDYTIPAYFASYLFNGDKEGIQEDELEEFEKWMGKELGHVRGHWSLENEAESYFQWSNDFNNVGGDVIDVSFVVMGLVIEKR